MRPAHGRGPAGRAALGVVGAVLTAGMLTGCAGQGPAGADVDTVGTAAQVALTAPDEPAAVAPLLDPVPAAGTVQVLDGPFTDRVEVGQAAVDDGRVTASLDVVKDVSELLALEVDVAWYDAQGVLVGSTRHVVDPEEAEEYHSPEGILGFPLEVAAPGAVTATLGFPVVVNE